MKTKQNRVPWLLSLFLILVLALAACNGADEPAAETSSEASAAVAAEADASAAAAEESAGQAEVAAEEAASGTENINEAPAASAAFVIVPAESEARFILSEELMGQPKTVVGATSALSGDVTIDAANPAASSIGPIQVDATTFVTDSDRRNGAIRRFILQSERPEYRYITFTPTAISGLPESVAVGDELTFQVTGDLQIRDVVNQETFNVTVTIVSESEITGSATTTVTRPDYRLTIPSVPNVANVSEDVTLALDFVARAQ